MKLHNLYQGILNSYFISDCNYFDDSWVLLFSEFIASETFASIYSGVKERLNENQKIESADL